MMFMYFDFFQALPYLGPIPKLADGSLVKINGMVPHHGNRLDTDTVDICYNIPSNL